MEQSIPDPPSLCTLLSLIDSLLFLLHHAHGRKNPTRACKGKLPPEPPVLVFVTKFLVLRRSIFDHGLLLRELHAHHSPVISIRLFRIARWSSSPTAG